MFPFLASFRVNKNRAKNYKRRKIKRTLKLPTKINQHWFSFQLLFHVNIVDHNPVRHKKRQAGEKSTSAISLLSANFYVTTRYCGSPQNDPNDPHPKGNGISRANTVGGSSLITLWKRNDTPSELRITIPCLQSRFVSQRMSDSLPLFPLNLHLS